MKKILFAAVTAALLSACGHPATPLAALPTTASSQLGAKSTEALLRGHRQIYLAIFQKLDANEDGYLDEYEASAAINVKDFASADRTRRGKISQKEFMAYADGANGVLGFMHQSGASFAKQARDAMMKAFTRLDKNHDRYLQQSELTEDALLKVDVNLRIDALHVNVHLATLDDDVFTEANHTETGKLTQAEWEDYCILSFIKGVNPNFKPNLGTPATGAPAEPSADATGDGTDTTY